MTAPRQSKPVAGRFFEDFRIGETLRHATPRTPCEGYEPHVALDLDYWAILPR